MSLWTPDPTFYPSPRDAAAAPPETLAYVAAFDRTAEQPDAIAVLDTDPASASYGEVVGWTDMPYHGDELHHFGWNMCSSALCPYAPHPHTERRYLVVPGLRSSRIMILDTKDNPRQPPVVKVLEAEELAKRAGYSRPHTLHCGPEGIYLTCLGGADGAEGPVGWRCSTTPRSRCSGGGSSTAARSTWRTTCGGTSPRTSRSPASGAPRR